MDEPKKLWVKQWISDEMLERSQGEALPRIKEHMMVQLLQEAMKHGYRWLEWPVITEQKSNGLHPHPPGATMLEYEASVWAVKA